MEQFGGVFQFRSGVPVDDPAGVCCLDAGLNATFAQPLQSINGLVVDVECVDLLPVATGV